MAYQRSNGETAAFIFANNKGMFVEDRSPAPNTQSMCVLSVKKSVNHRPAIQTFKTVTFSYARESDLKIQKIDEIYSLRYNIQRIKMIT